MSIIEDKEKMFAPCGMNCAVCYVHLKKKKPCNGCLSNDENKPERCRICDIKVCAKEKGFTYCFECSDFPCKRIKHLDTSYRKRYAVSLINNSGFVSERGFERFMQSEKLRWTCDCGGAISLHDKVCSQCGSKYKNAFHPSKD